MYVYWVASPYDERIGTSSIRMLPGTDWYKFEPGTATIYVHPDIDYHYIQGECIILGKKAKLRECPDNYQIKEQGVYILAYNYKAALELLRPKYSPPI